jgi:hypothetical protein
MKVHYNNLAILALALSVGVACSSGSKKKHSGGGSSVDEGDATGEKSSEVSEIGPESSGAPDVLTGNPNEAPSDMPAPGPVADPMAQPLGVGVRNFDQINATMSALTGVSMASQTGTLKNNVALTIGQVYLAEKSGLPTSNDVKSISPSIVSSTTKLAGAYCSGLINVPANATQRSAVFGTFNFAGLPSAVLTNNAELAGLLVDKLLGTGLGNLGNKADYVASIDGLIKGLVTGKPDTAATTTAVVTGACAAVMASAGVLLY